MRASNKNPAEIGALPIAVRGDHAFLDRAHSGRNNG